MNITSFLSAGLHSTGRKAGKLLLGSLLASSLVAPLQSDAAVVWGNTYLYGNSSTAAVTPTSSQWVTFTATEDTIVSAAQIYNSTAVSGTPSFSVFLREVGQDGKPTGDPLGSGTLNPSATGWQRAELTSTTLVKGKVYALEVVSLDGSYPWRLNAGPTGGIQPYGVPDEHFLRGTNTGNPVTGQTVWLLETNLGRAIGQPYSQSVAQNVVSTTSTAAQRFIFDQAAAGGGSIVESVTVRLGVTEIKPIAPVTVSLIDESGTVLATSSMDLSDAPVGANLYTFDFDTTLSLIDGNTYYVGVYSNAASGGPINWYGWVTTDSALPISASFQGSAANGVVWASQSNYTTAPTEYVNRDYYFSLTVVPEPSTVALIAFAGAGVLFACRRGIARRVRH